MADVPDDAGPKQDRRDDAGRFTGGASGNPAGRPAGRKNAITMAMEELLDGEADAITRVCIERAKAGDHHAMKLVMDRILPTRRGRPVQFDLPEIEGAADVTKAHGSILRACAAGVLTPEEGTLIAGVLDAKRRSIETEEIVRRLAALEQGEAERAR